MRFHMYDSTTGVIPEYFDLTNCNANGPSLTHSVGLALEGVSALGDLVQGEPQQDLRDL